MEETGSSALLSRVVQGLQSANLLLGAQVDVGSARCLGGLPLSGLGLDPSQAGLEQSPMAVSSSTGKTEIRRSGSGGKMSMCPGWYVTQM